MLALLWPHLYLDRPVFQDLTQQHCSHERNLSCTFHTQFINDLHIFKSMFEVSLCKPVVLKFFSPNISQISPHLFWCKIIPGVSIGTDLGAGVFKIAFGMMVWFALWTFHLFHLTLQYLFWQTSWLDFQSWCFIIKLSIFVIFASCSTLILRHIR